MSAYRSRAELAGAGVSASSFTLSKPAGTADGDAVFAVLTARDPALGLTMTAAPAGWTLYQADYTWSGGGWIYCWIYYKIASGEPASWSSWTLNRAVTIYNHQTFAIQTVNASDLIDSISYNQNGASAASSPATVPLYCVVNGTGNTLMTIAVSCSPSGGPSNITSDVGTEMFESEGLAGTHIGVSLYMVALGAATSVSSNSTSTHTGTTGFLVHQFALNPGIVDATVVAPAAVATASRVAPQVVQGVVAVPAVATARGVVPLSITGTLTVIVPARLATATAPLPAVHASRIAIAMSPETPAPLELVEDP